MADFPDFSAQVSSGYLFEFVIGIEAENGGSLEFCKDFARGGPVEANKVQCGKRGDAGWNTVLEVIDYEGESVEAMLVIGLIYPDISRV